MLIGHLYEASDGRIDITYYDADALVGVDDVFDAVTKGTLDIDFTWPGWGPAEHDPGYMVIHNFPGVWTGAEEATLYMTQYGGIELMREEYAKLNAHYAWCFNSTKEPFHTLDKPIYHIEDFEGMKVRTGPGLTFDLWPMLGATPVSISPTETYTALQTGVIDGAELIGWADNWNYGFQEVAKYALWPSFHSQTVIGELSVNLDVWNGLPDDIKAIIELGGVYANYLYGYWAIPPEFEAKQKFIDYGTILTSLSQEEMDIILGYAIEIGEAQRAKSEFSNKAIDSIWAFLKATGRME